MWCAWAEMTVQENSILCVVCPQDVMSDSEPPAAEEKTEPITDEENGSIPTHP